MASSQELSFDLSDLKELRDQTQKVCDELKEQKQSLKKGLEQLRNEWRTPAGDYFFQHIDDSWEGDVEKFVKTISVFEEIINDAINQFQEVVDKANSIDIDFD